MKHSNFVHLHTHSQYSLLDGACRIASVVELAKQYKMPALAITDHGNMFGAVEFYKAAKAAGIKPIIGCEAYIAGGSRLERSPSSHYPDGGFHLVLLVKNETGYRNLMKLCSAAFLEGFYHRPRIDRELLREHSEGLIATSACLKGEVNWRLLNGSTEQAVATAREYNDIFGQGNFYLEIQNHGLEKELMLIPKIDAISRETGIPMVVTNDCHYLQQKDAEAHDALLCIQTGKLVSDTNRMRYNSDQIYFKTYEEMEKLFGDFKPAMDNTLEIAESCNFEIEMGELKLPVFPLPTKFVDPDEYLEHLCREGFTGRYDEVTDEIEQRLVYELGVIKRMGYAGYFLITKDFCDYARSQKIRVGPGRGSAAGSIVSYLLRITDVDPIRFDLLFERFLNPERISMPDIDIDFADRGRDQIIKYVIEKYGKENVSQIITFGTMAARGVIRDVGRVLAIPYGEVDKIAKLIPEGPGVTLDEALEKVKELSDLRKNDKRIAKLIDFALTLEGLARHCSTHAAGVVIAPTALTNYVPLFKGSKDEITTQYDMKMVEEIGLLKMDFLGLRTLTVIDDALRMITENYPDVEIEINELPLDDTEVFDIFARGETIGVFQFESPGMREYLRKLAPENFTDITAMNALYRPGPLDSGMIDKYIKRKKGAAKLVFAHPVLEDILGSTYGVIVFQEQVLQIANRLAGYSMGKADFLRKAMGKKDVKMMAAQKKEFLAGATENNIDRKVAVDIFEQIETFARYGFNKAHSTCYALVAYQTAYLKHYYPKEFMAALMTSEISSSNRINALMEECRRMGIKVLPPDVNESVTDFSVVDDTIRFGLQAVKNVGEAPTRGIVQARLTGERFASLADLIERVPPGLINRRTLESLIASGACDSLEGNRAQKFEVVDKILEFGSKVAEQASSHDLFADGSGTITRTAPALPDISDWPNSRKLTEEKEMLGFYVSGHPLDKYRDELSYVTTATTDVVSSLPDKREVVLGGIITGIRTLLDKKGNTMAFVTLEDFTGSIDLLLFSDAYSKCREAVQPDQLVLATGTVSTREGKPPSVLASEVIVLSQLTEKFNCQLILKIGPDCSDKTLDEAFDFLKEYKGNTPVLLATRENGKEWYIKARKYAVNLDFQLLDQLKEILGETSAYIRPLQKKK